MNILKKALLLIPFILMGILLLSSYTTNSGGVPNPDDFDIVLSGGGLTRSVGGGSCNETVYLFKNTGTEMPENVTITVMAMIQLHTHVLFEETFDGQTLFGNNTDALLNLERLYEEFSGTSGPYTIIATMAVNYPNSSFTRYNYKSVYSPYCP